MTRITRPSAILVADWSKSPRRRQVWFAECTERYLEPVPGDWTLDVLLEAARDLTYRHGRVLVGIDAALGLPRAMLEAADLDPPASFVDWLLVYSRNEDFFRPVERPEDWSLKRPFFRLGGAGSRTAFESNAGFDLRRKIERLTSASPAWIVSGMPGAVGGATLSLWQELSPLLARDDRSFTVWPFEEPEFGKGVFLTEIYPRAAYAVALADRLPTAPLRLAKRRVQVRIDALDRLATSSWVRQHGVRLGDMSSAYHGEDAFDALITAAALLRSQLESQPLADEEIIDPVAEGAIVPTGAIDFSRRMERLLSSAGSPQAELFDPAERPARTPTQPQNLRRDIDSEELKGLRCPIPHCDFRYRSGRSGWDAHVGSRRSHPWWHPEIRDAEERCRRFRDEFRGWFLG